jgi:RND family efflux transporter MFP subunit
MRLLPASLLTALVLFPTALIPTVLFPTTLLAEEEEPKTVLVTVATPERGVVPDRVTAYGEVAPIPARTINMSLSRSGEIIDVDVTPGQGVRKGEKLIAFGADASVVIAWEQAVSNLNLVKEQRAHTAELLQQQMATRSALAEADKAVADATGALEVLRRQGGGKPSETVVAPFEGIVVTVAVNSGDRVAEKTPLLTLARADSMSITLGVEPSDRRKLKPGQPVQLTPVDGGEEVAGTVTSVGAMVNAKSRLIDVVIAPTSGTVILGETFRGDITVGELEGWVIPRNAVLTDYEGPHVFQVDGEKKAVRVGVTIVGMPGKTAVVDGPIDPDLKIVTIGNYQLTDGTSTREDDSQL